ncbi:hypothetical protein [Nocardioides ferulae]|uniref:hypothetical protein n=1 Tax=Nocardioides ferulae TaxID=2340821 RepID=UPI000EADA999|nr:hypothetical protein [Nocardioides ferulae]
MSILSVVVSRAELGLPPLELSTDPDATTYWLAQVPAEWPLRAELQRGPRPAPPAGAVVPRPRRWDDTVESLAVPRPRTPGLVLPLEVLVSGRSAVDLYAARATLAQALGQREFEVMVVRSRRESIHRAGPSSPTWSSVPPGPQGDRTLRATVRIPLPDPAQPRLAPARPA